jgi:hypothetical protein
MVSFLVYININYVPVTKLFLESINKFATFKMIPPEIVDKILEFLGMAAKLEETSRRLL